MTRVFTAAGALLLATAGWAAEAPSNAELYDIIQAQQAELERLGNSQADSRTHVGGYGELHYNNLDSGSEIDFHRFVLFLNHAFTDDIRFYSEVEIEHSLAGEGQPGEVELEQAYLEFDTGESSNVKAGLFLVPVGIINETHEPPVFYGVERNPVEHDIIPATWWEGGAAFTHNSASGFSYDVAVHSGLNIGAGYDVRDGRQKVAEASAEELAVSGRIKYTGIAGLELAASIVTQSDVAQDPAIDGDAGTLLEMHAVWNSGPVTVKALYAGWNFDSAAAEALGRDTQDGFYVEGAYKLNPSWGVFARYNDWDNGGLAAETAISQTNVGVNWWPHKDVVVKFDIQNQGKAGNNNGFNVGIGYQF